MNFRVQARCHGSPMLQQEAPDHQQEGPTVVAPPQAGVGFTLKRSKQVKADILTLPRFSRIDAIRAIYGSAVASNLVSFATCANWPENHADCPKISPSLNDTPSFSVEGVVATGNVNYKKSTFLLFINGRTADCLPLKTAIESAYVALHSKAASFWAFVDVRVPTAHVDVNVHPTKSEVALLFQPEMIEAVRVEIEAVLSSCHSVRTFARGDPSRQWPLSGVQPGC
jgi:DNA mismatch repair protein MLH1